MSNPFFRTIFKQLDWPSPKQNKLLLLAGLVILVIIYPLMSWFFLQSGDTTNTFVSQLSFSGLFLKNQYAQMILSGDLNSYRIAQCLDYGFMISYGLLVFCVNLIISRKYDVNSKWHSLGLLASLTGVLATCCDATENAFILLTLSDPAGFPNWWAVAHSSFALLKWGLLVFAITWALISAVHYFLVRKK